MFCCALKILFFLGCIWSILGHSLGRSGTSKGPVCLNWRGSNLSPGAWPRPPCWPPLCARMRAMAQVQTARSSRASVTCPSPKGAPFPEPTALMAKTPASSSRSRSRFWRFQSLRHQPRGRQPTRKVSLPTHVWPEEELSLLTKRRVALAHQAPLLSKMQRPSNGWKMTSMI